MQSKLGRINAENAEKRRDFFVSKPSPNSVVGQSFFPLRSSAFSASLRLSGWFQLHGIRLKPMNWTGETPIPLNSVAGRGASGRRPAGRPYQATLCTFFNAACRKSGFIRRRTALTSVHVPEQVFFQKFNSPKRAGFALRRLHHAGEYGWQHFSATGFAENSRAHRQPRGLRQR